MSLSTAPIIRNRSQQLSSVESIYITTAQIGSVCGDRVDSKGNTISRSDWHGHWIRGLSAGPQHRWKVTQKEIVFGISEPLPGEREYFSDYNFYRAKRNMSELWQQLVLAVDPEFREAISS